MVTEGRILCIEVMDKHVVVGTKEGCILMYHCNTKKRQSQFPKLPDSVLCMKYVRRLDVLLVGLANGSLYVYRRDDLLKGGKRLLPKKTLWNTVIILQERTFFCHLLLLLDPWR